MAEGTHIEDGIRSTEMQSTNNAETTCTPESQQYGWKRVGAKKQSVSAVAPQDTGRAAWKTLAAAAVVNSALLGPTLSFGVFQDFLLHDAKLPNVDRSSWIRVLSAGLPWLGAPLMTWCCRRLNIRCQYYVWLGWAVCVISLLGAAFCASITGLIFTQGLLYGIGILITDVPLHITINTWFLDRRGFASGIYFAVSDLGGVGFAYLVEYLLQTHGFRVTFLTLAAVIFVAAGPAICMLRERYSCSVASVAHQTISSTQDIVLSPAGIPQSTAEPSGPYKPYWTQTIFYIISTSNILQSLAAYLPSIYLPSYATDLGFSYRTGATLLAVANVAGIIGSVVFGKLSDKVNVHSLIIASALVTGLATFLLWGLGTHLAQLMIFAVLYGGFGAGFCASWARIGLFFGQADAPKVFSTLCFGRGIGSIVSGPLSAALLQRGQRRKGERYGNGVYAEIVLFVGACMIGSTVLTVGARIIVWWQGREKKLGMDEESSHTPKTLEGQSVARETVSSAS